MDAFSQPHRYPGKLFVVEGIDGSGKSTQVKLLHRWLKSRGHTVFFTEWNSSALVKETTRIGKKKRVLTPTTFSLLHATDFADRLFYNIIPPLKAGMVVLADRYAYTAFARDVVRGVDPAWVRQLYGFAVKPDIAFYFRVPVDVSLGRVLSGRQEIKYYEAGMDMGLSDDPVKSFSEFQRRIAEEYEQIVKEYGLCVIEAESDIDAQQEQVREHVLRVLNASKRREEKSTWRAPSSSDGDSPTKTLEISKAA